MIIIGPEKLSVILEKNTNSITSFQMNNQLVKTSIQEQKGCSSREYELFYFVL